jgi:Pyruvate/2-oxoacid:ferredoxin oxidoreductase delta subunit
MFDEATGGLNGCGICAPECPCGAIAMVPQEA